jgi:hypothetical protein
MLTVNVRRAAPAVVLAASLALGAAACGSGGSHEDTVDGAPPATSRPATPSGTTAAPSTTTPPASPTGTGNGTTTVPPTGGRSTPVTGAVADRVVYFSSSVRAPGEVHQVLRDRAALERFAAAVAKNDARAAAKISASGAATDFTRNVLVGWAESTGCSAATSAVLLAAGNTLRLHVVQPKPTPECFTDFRVTVVFEVPKDRLPARPAFA